MAPVSSQRLSELLEPYLGSASVSPDLIPQLSLYLDLLVKWNARTNLTAIRDPEQIVRRHFGESLFAGLHLPAQPRTLLDYGSGAGFPGLPIQLLRPELTVTLAESQGKKASFLREAVRLLKLETEVWARRVEFMPEELRFDVVALRAVEKMELAIQAARLRVHPGGRMLVLTTGMEGILVPESRTSRLRLLSC